MVFSSSEQFLSNLQAKNITVQEATCEADLLIARTKSLFGMFFDEVEKESYNLTEEPALPRFRKIPKRYDDGSTPHHLILEITSTLTIQSGGEDV